MLHAPRVNPRRNPPAIGLTERFIELLFQTGRDSIQRLGEQVMKADPKRYPYYSTRIAVPFAVGRVLEYEGRPVTFDEIEKFADEISDESDTNGLYLKFILAVHYAVYKK